MVIMEPDERIPDIVLCRGAGRCHKRPPCAFCAVFGASLGLDDIDEFVRRAVIGQ